MNAPDPFHSGYVALVGWPNVGKSTLLNAFLGAKLSIVSPHPQTTRDAILGILNEPGRQIVFLDTPGWLRPADTFQSFMKRAVVRSIHDDADVILWLVDASPLSAELKAFGETLQKTGKPVVVAINKTDRVKDPALLANLTAEVEALFSGAPVFRISAQSGQGLVPLKAAIADRLPPSPPYFPTDQVTDRWERFYVAELIREQLFRRFREEIPHAAAVVIDDFVEKEGRKDRIRALIIVETEGQKRIVIGNGGRAVKDIGQRARPEIEKQLGRPVYLEIVVKVHKKWRDDAQFLKRLQENPAGSGDF